MRKTIAKTATRKIETLKETYTRCVVKSLNTGFVATHCAAAFAWGDLYRFRSARLHHDGDHLTIYVHSNLWYELRPVDEAAEDEEERSRLDVAAAKAAGTFERELTAMVAPAGPEALAALSASRPVRQPPAHVARVLDQWAAQEERPLPPAPCGRASVASIIAALGQLQGHADAVLDVEAAELARIDTRLWEIVEELSS